VPVCLQLRGSVDSLAEGAPGAKVGMLDGQDPEVAGGLPEADLWRFVVPQLRVAVEAHEQWRG
jgi:hypothetical protein